MDYNREGERRNKIHKRRASSERLKNPNNNRSAMKWECHSIDIKSEYLQGNTIQRKIFLKVPKPIYCWYRNDSNKQIKEHKKRRKY